jgi:hypothetical protein
MLGSGLGELEWSGFHHSNVSIGAGNAELPTHTFAVGKTSIEQRHTVYAAIADSQVA